MAETRYVDMPEPLGIFADELFKRGVEYLDALEVLAGQKDRQLLYASYFLFAHSLELLLKSFLAANGVTKKIISHKLSNKLSEIIKLCELNSIPHVVNLREFVAHTFEMNKDFDFRYPSGYNLSMPRPSECIPVARALAAAIEPIVNREALSANIRFASETGKHRGKKIRWSD
jgi:hypothetical protein